MSGKLDSLRGLRTAHPTSWTQSLRDEALAIFEDQGVPTRKLENWKGTNLAPLSAMRFARVGPGAVTAPQVGHESELVFVDGHYDAQASSVSDLPKGIRALSLARVIEAEPELVKGRLGRLPDLKREPLAALQTAFLEDGAVLVLEAGAQTTQPIRMRFVSTADAADQPSAAFPRLLVIAGEGSRAALVHEHVCHESAPGFTAFVAEFFLEKGSHVESVQIQDEGAERIHFTSLHAHLEKDAKLESHVFSLGAGLVRSELSIGLTEPGADSKLCGLFVGSASSHIDHFTTVDHASPHCTSDQEYRGVLGDRSKGVFRGRVIVRPDAQKTDARQSNPNLLLSDHASIDTKPQLEIYADDIRASHGSTIGQLDANALFFLQARGIGAAEARLLLTAAFAQGIADQIANESLRQIVLPRIETALTHLEHDESTGSIEVIPER